MLRSVSPNRSTTLNPLSACKVCTGRTLSPRTGMARPFTPTFPVRQTSMRSSSTSAESGTIQFRHILLCWTAPEANANGSLIPAVMSQAPCPPKQCRGSGGTITSPIPTTATGWRIPSRPWKAILRSLDQSARRGHCAPVQDSFSSANSLRKVTSLRPTICAGCCTTTATTAPNCYLTMC